ncbi:hypothetical protein ACLOJK_020008 [Asimina triloba]
MEYFGLADEIACAGVNGMQKQMYRSAKNGADVLATEGFHRRRRQHLRDVGILDSSSCSEGHHLQSTEISHDWDMDSLTRIPIFRPLKINS